MRMSSLSTTVIVRHLLVYGQGQDATDLALWLKQLMNDFCNLTWKISPSQCPSTAVAMSGSLTFFEGIMLPCDKDARHDTTVASWHISVWLHEEERRVSSDGGPPCRPIPVGCRLH